MAVYFPQSPKAGQKKIGHISIEDRLNNQVVFNGTDDQYQVENGIFYLEYLKADSTVTIRDWAGRLVADNVAELFNDYSPVRIDGGIKITGQVIFAKGFYQRDVSFGNAV